MSPNYNVVNTFGKATDDIDDRHIENSGGSLIVIPFNFSLRFDLSPLSLSYIYRLIWFSRRIVYLGNFTNVSAAAVAVAIAIANAWLILSLFLTIPFKTKQFKWFERRFPITRYQICNLFSVFSNPILDIYTDTHSDRNDATTISYKL